MPKDVKEAETQGDKVHTIESQVQTEAVKEKVCVDAAVQMETVLSAAV
jgi:hypothetical protein